MLAPVQHRDWLAERPFTLVLSAGFFGFFSHTGLLAALERAGLMPARVVGVSAGALAGGLWASGLDAESLARELLALRRDSFWDPGLPLGGLLRGRKFADEIARVLAPLGVRTIEQCRVPFAAVVHDVLRHRPLALEHGELAAAIRASCTVPLMFRPMWKNGRLLVDGGVSDRIGRCALRPGERALVHYLPSRRRWRSQPVPKAIASIDARVLVTPELPALGPFALERAPEAYELTLRYASEWLSSRE
jgi:NTE family protein